MSSQVRGPVETRWIAHPLVQAVLAGLAGLLVSYNALLVRVALSLHANDFGKFYEAAWNWRRGQSLYLPTSATHMLVGTEWREMLNMNPPHFHVVVLPFTWLSVSTAALVWLAANVAAGIASGAIVASAIGLRVRARHLLPIICAVLLCAATAATAGTGQFTGLLLVPMTLSWRAARQGRWLASGAWLGLLISIKPFVGLFVPVLAARREWRGMAGAFASGALLFAVGLTVFGWREHVAWIQAMSGVDWAWSAMNGSMLAPFARLLGPSPVFAPLASRPALMTTLWLIAGAVVVLATLWRSGGPVDQIFALTILAALLVSPLGWVYYAWLALPPCLALWRASRPAVVAVGLALLCVPLLAIGLGQPSAIATATIGSSYTWAFLALWVGVLMTAAPTASPAVGLTESTMT